MVWMVTFSKSGLSDVKCHMSLKKNIGDLKLRLNSMMEHFENGEDKWKCGVCEKIFSRRAHMENLLKGTLKDCHIPVTSVAK